MKLLSLLVVMVVAGAVKATKYSCSQSESEECPAHQEFKYLFFEVSNQEGFNLRRDVYMRYAIMFAEMHKRREKLNWKLVLPPFYRLPHWRNEKYSSEPVQWSSLFDIESLKTYAPVVELKDVFNHTSRSINLDRELILLNYENPFENGKFEEKWNTLKTCDYTSQSFWGYATRTYETVCVKFQGKVSKLWAVISLHSRDKSVMVYHAEIPLHDSYGTKSYWDCRKSMKFNSELVQIAAEYIAEHFQCSTDQCETYLSVHWRRGDYVYSRRNELPSIKGAANQIDSAMNRIKLPTKDVFVATDANSIEKSQLQNALRDLGYTAHFYIPNDSELAKFRDGGVAIIEQIICSHAAYFIGSHESTFSFRIQEEREILGFNTSTTFNRFCPDQGLCEAPSIWTIVH